VCLCQIRLRLSCEVDGCKPLQLGAAEAVSSATQAAQRGAESEAAAYTRPLLSLSLAPSAGCTPPLLSLS
jgi:hypothetical protein